MDEQIPDIPMRNNDPHESYLAGVEFGKYIHRNSGMMRKGYFGVGIEEGKSPSNYGTLFRTAQIMGADFCFVIGDKCKRQFSDTTNSLNNMPVYHYKDLENFISHLPLGVRLVSIEMGDDAVKLSEFKHPKNAIYILGNEKDGVSEELLNKSHAIVKLEGECSMNVSVAGSIVIYDRVTRRISPKTKKENQDEV